MIMTLSRRLTQRAAHRESRLTTAEHLYRELLTAKEAIGATEITLGNKVCRSRKNGTKIQPVLVPDGVSLNIMEPWCDHCIEVKTVSADAVIAKVREVAGKHVRISNPTKKEHAGHARKIAER